MSETTESSASAVPSVEPDEPVETAARTVPQDDDVSDLEEEGEYAADYLEVLLDILDLDGDLDLDVEGGRAAVAIVGTGLDVLVGQDGATLDALQDLTRLAVQQQSGARSRLMLDVAGYRARRRVQLTDLGTAAARRVMESGKPERLSAMSPFERKVVHDAVAAIDGVHSESEGEEPQRRVVVLPD
jgi:spoIIIJ-associated protein